jgi:hypothetical protein
LGVGHREACGDQGHLRGGQGQKQGKTWGKIVGK